MDKKTLAKRIKIINNSIQRLKSNEKDDSIRTLMDEIDNNYRGIEYLTDYDIASSDELQQVAFMSLSREKLQLQDARGRAYAAKDGAPLVAYYNKALKEIEQLTKLLTDQKDEVAKSFSLTSERFSEEINKDLKADYAETLDAREGRRLNKEDEDILKMLEQLGF